jgi:carbonic anhydrase
VVEQSLRNLLTFPYVRGRVEAGDLQLHGAYFGIATGDLLVRDPVTGVFGPAAEDRPSRATLARCDEQLSAL